MKSREKAQKNTKNKTNFFAFCAFLRLSLFLSLVFVLGAAEQESAPQNYQAIGYFYEHCARCHGPDGVNYDLKHLAQASDGKLREIITAMAENQGQAPLDARQVAVQVAYHRSFMDGKPFMILNSAKAENGQLLLSGEATPESKVQICIGEKSYPATIEDQSWKAILPIATNLSEVLIVATKGNAKTELKASDSFSHQK